LPPWWNGRRARLKIEYREVCQFESDRGHQTFQIPILNPQPVSGDGIYYIYCYLLNQILGRLQA